jgi:hypothetical protein
MQGIEGSLRLPGGSGESGMIIFGRNCAVLNFLAITNSGSEVAFLETLRNSASMI